jgi:hypothetical protein
MRAMTMFRNGKTKFLLSLSVMLVALALMGCDRRSGSNSISQGIGDSEATSCTEMAPAQRDLLVQNVARVKIGDLRSVVVATLGNPTLTENFAAKESDRVIGVDTYYIVKKCGNHSQIEDNDRFVRLYFHLDDRLGSIESFGVGGVIHRSDLPADPKVHK